MNRKLTRILESESESEDDPDDPDDVDDNTEENPDGEGESESNFSSTSVVHVTPAPRSSIPQKEKKDVKRKDWIHYFRKPWTEKYRWITASPKGRTYYRCTVCGDDLKAACEKKIKRHELTSKHQQNSRSLGKQPSLLQSAQDTAVFNKKIKGIEIKMAMYIVEHNISLNSADHFSDLVRSLHNSLTTVTCDRTKCTSIIQNVIGKCSQDELFSEMRMKKFSILLDESTDLSCTKDLSVVVRLVRETLTEFIIADEFLCLIPVTDGTAKGLFKSIVEFFISNKIPYEENLIGLATDGASVMTGKENSVMALFKKAVPRLFLMKCSCHSLALCASYAAKKIPCEIEDVLSKVYNYLSCSPKRQQSLAVVQEISEVKVHKILRKSDTRWLSYAECVRRFLEQLPALITFFKKELAVFDNQFKNLGSEQKQKRENVRYLLQMLSDTTFKLYLEFLDYILPIINDLNKEFQSEKTRIHVLYSQMEDTCRRIMRNYLKKECVVGKSIETIEYAEPTNLRSDVYAGPKAGVTIEKSGITGLNLKSFYDNCKLFYVELIAQIYVRFPFKDQGMKSLKNLDFINPLKIKDTESLAPVVAYFDEALSIDVVEIENELHTLQNCSQVDTSADPMKFWHQVNNMKKADGTKVFQHISILVTHILTLPHSTAAVERTFSVITDNKTKKRNKLEEETLTGILLGKGYLKRQGKHCSNFNVTPFLPYHNSQMYKN